MEMYPLLVCLLGGLFFVPGFFSFSLSSSSGEEAGPRFMDDFPPSFAYSSRVGGSLRCVAHGHPEPKTEWVSSIDFLPVQNVTGLREVLPNGNLRFLPFSSDGYRPDVHSGSYRCRASNPSGSIISPEVALTPVVDIPYAVEINDVTVAKGNTAMLRCQVPAELKDFVTITSWVQDASINIYPDFKTGKTLMLPSGELFIFSSDASDSLKTFSCRTLHKLTNEAKTSSPAKLVVKEPEGPSAVKIMVEREQYKSPRAGEDLYLSCLAQGNPAPSYLWHKEEDGRLTELKPTSLKNPSSPLLRLQVKQEDGGTYICRANNSHSSEKTRIHLSVYVPLRVQLSPSTVTVDVGRGTSFRCLVSGSPVESIEWYKDGGLLWDMTGDGRYKIGPREVLKVSSVLPSDVGMYQCIAKNKLFSAQDSAEIRLGSILPSLIYRFSEQTITPGPSVSLKCTAVGNPPPQFTWTLDGFPLPESERFLVGQYVTIHDNVISHVNITAAREEDGGLYSCDARNAMGTVSHSARLNIYGPPFVRPVPVVKATAGKPFTIHCPVSGYPIESIAWEKDGRVIPISTNLRTFPNGTVHFQHVGKGDEGALTCRAKGRQGSSSRDITIRVLTPPKVMPFQFMNSLLKEGMRAALSCQVLEGDRPIDIIWEFEGRVLNTQNTGINIRIPDEYSSTLVIESLSSLHNGKYTCIAENAAGQDRHTSELTVQIPPKWTLEPHDITVPSGGLATLQCMAEGHPSPVLEWKKASPSSPGEYRVLPTKANGTLRFNPASKGDEGPYLCEARNGVGAGLSKVVFLKVSAPPEFLEKEQEKSVRVGEKAILTCRARGDPQIQVSWTNKHGRIEHERNHRISIREKELEGEIVSELVINSVERFDSGLYGCKAANTFGSDQASVTLNVQEPPEQPINLRILDVGSRSVGISWLQNFNGNSPLVNFIIQSKFPSETWTEAEVEELAVPATQTTATVEGLAPSTMYQLRVLAQNGVGFSVPSDVVQVTTTEESPEGPPLDLLITADSSTSLKIRWDPPERSLWHGQILGYYLGFRELSPALAEESVSIPASSKGISSGDNMHGYHFKTVEVEKDFGGETVLEKLKKFTRYSVIVQAFNGKGAGPATSPLIGTTLQDIPSLPPENLACQSSSPQTLVLSWDPVPLDGRNGVVQGYKVEFYPISDGIFENLEESEMKIVQEREVVLHSLRKWTNYSVTIRAFTGIGDGERTEEVICQTEEDVPNPPAGIKAFSSSRRSIHVSWLSPLSPNGEIMKYTVYLLKVGEGAKVERNDVDGSHHKFEWGGLSEDKPYEVWITASTRQGEGQPTQRKKVITTNKVPASITSFSRQFSLPWKREVSLDCFTIGIPEPKVKWEFTPVTERENTREHLRGANSLILRNLTTEDSGNYSCITENDKGKDKITYSLSVITPPGSGVIQVAEVGHSFFSLAWGVPTNGGSPIKGYLINYRRENGEWEELEVGRKVTSHTLKDLFCGSTYHIFLTAFNKIGSGLPSDIVKRNTLGRVPRAPKGEDALLSNHTSVLIRLDLWNDEGCPIQKFLIEYRQEKEKKWNRTPAELNGSAKFYTLTGLHSSRKYEIRVTAGNDAGETLAKYEILTQKEGHPQQAVRLPGESSFETLEKEGEGQESSNSKMLLVFPTILAFFAVTALIGFVCYVKRKQDWLQSGSQSYSKTVVDEPPPYHQGNPYTHTLRKEYPDLTAPYPKGPPRDPSFVDDVCPYATFQLPENPPTRPVLTGGFPGEYTLQQPKLNFSRTGDTLYNVGNVYSGPYHAVQSAPQREQDYILEDKTDAEVKNILLHTYQDESKYGYHQPMPQQQRVPTLYRTGNRGSAGIRSNRRSEAYSEHSSCSSTEESSPRFHTSQQRTGSSTTTTNTTNSKGTPGSGSGSGPSVGRLRSSSGYSSSHTEETSFTFQPPPPDLSGLSEFPGGYGNNDMNMRLYYGVEGEMMQVLGEDGEDDGYNNTKRRKRTAGRKKKGNYHIDV